MNLSPRYSNSDTHEDETARFFGTGSQFRSSNAEGRIQWEPIGIIGSSEMHVCYLGGVGAPKIPAFKAPELIQELHLDGFISQSNFSSLFRPLVNLKLLEIHISSFECLNVSTSGNQLDLPNLECLDISAANFTYFHGIRADMGGILENISAILTAPTNFPVLTYLSVSSPTFPPKDEDFARSILHCVAAHKSTLKFLNIESEFALVQDSYGHPYEERFYSESPSKKDLNLAAVNSAKDVDLSSFHYFSLAKAANTEIWRTFIQTQDNLEYLQLWCEESYFPFPRELLRRNDSLVHTIALNVDVLSPQSPSTSTTRPIGTQVDLSVFQECPYLKILFLKGNEKCLMVNGTDQTALNQANVINAEMLPETLEFLKLMHLLIDSDDAGFIATGLPKLNKLELTDIGEEGQFGLRVSDLALLLQTNVIQKLEIVSSINRASFTQSSGPANGYEVMTKVLLAKQNTPSSFRVSRNTDGGFDPMSDLEEEDTEDDISDDDDDDEVEDGDSDEEALRLAPCDPDEIVPAAICTAVEAEACETPPEDDPCEITIAPSAGNNNRNEVCQDSDVDQGNTGSPIGSAHVYGDPPITHSTIELNVVRSGLNASVIGIEATVGVDVEMVDAEEANVDFFVKDFTRGQTPPS